MGAFATNSALAVLGTAGEPRHGSCMTRCSRIALAALLCACDPQADPGYLGEPLMTLQGHVTSSGPMPSLEAAMLWQRGDPPSTGDQELATRAPVEAGFPARFTLHLYQPPPGAARRSLVPGEVTYARANAGAVPYGIAAGAVGALPASANGAYGIDANHWVVYLASDVPAGSLTAWWLGAALPAGFHLLRVAAVNPQCITLALPGEQLVLNLGTIGLGPAGGTCP